MSSSLPRRRSGDSGRSASAWFLIVGTLGFSLACSNDDETPRDPGDDPAGLRPDASIPLLPGDGREPAPDVTAREVIPLPSNRYIDSVSDVIETLSPSRPTPSPADAGDAASGAGTPDGGADGAP